MIRYGHFNLANLNSEKMQEQIRCSDGSFVTDVFALPPSQVPFPLFGLSNKDHHPFLAIHVVTIIYPWDKTSLMPHWHPEGMSNVISSAAQNLSRAG